MKILQGALVGGSQMGNPLKQLAALYGRKTFPLPGKSQMEMKWTSLWQQRDISNFEYLMLLNFAAGRSFNDLNQVGFVVSAQKDQDIDRWIDRYPVF